MLSGSHSPEDTLTRISTESDANVESSTLVATQSLPPPTLEPSPGSDNAHDDDSVSSKRKINKQKSSSSSSERHDSPQEIAEGNCLVAKGEKSDEKINTPKKRFFDLKRTAESASHRIQSISPSRFALSLTPKLKRKSAANHKLSQLERQSNLFIRDGAERKINKSEDGSTSVAMETAAKHQHDPAEGTRSKKSSLIPSFNFRIPSASAANKSDGNLAKSGANLKNLCKNFSSETKQKPPATAYPNYEEIDIPNEDEDDDERQNMITNAPDVPNDNCAEDGSSTAMIRTNFSPEKLRKAEGEEEDEEEFNSIESCGGSTSKPAYSRFENIPVRPRKGQVPHMENYCLFDPSVDFCNEKDLWRQNFPTTFAPQNFRNFHVTEEAAAAVAVVSVYDVSEHDERIGRLARHNYYEIDPELLEQDEAAIAGNLTQADQARSSNITQTSSGSSSSGDYPSLFNSVIETTPSSTVTIESTDESNAYGKLSNGGASNQNQSSRASDAINQANVALENNDDDDDVESVITISSIVTATGTKKKKSPQFDRIVKQMARNSPPTADHANQPAGKSTKINLPFYNETLSFDPLKSSHSLPQLQSITVRQQQIADGDYDIEINNRTTIQLRRSVRRLRPLSSDSLDSGFTTPSPPNEAPRNRSSDGDNKQVDNLNCDTKAPVKGGESTVLTQCDNIQQLIEVSGC